MTENSSRDKIVKNPLFNIAVTGGTIEDFSQNAVLLPAQQLPPPIPTELSLKPEVQENTSSIGDQTSQLYQTFDPYQNFNTLEQNNQNQSGTSNFFYASNQGSVNQNYPYLDQAHYTSQPPYQQPTSQPPQQPISQPPQQPSGFSSVFSTFSRVLNFSSSPTPPEPSAPPLSSIESLLTTENQEQQPVPLFNPNSFHPAGVTSTPPLTTDYFAPPPISTGQNFNRGPSNNFGTYSANFSSPQNFPESTNFQNTNLHSENKHIYRSNPSPTNNLDVNSSNANISLTASATSPLTSTSGFNIPLNPPFPGTNPILPPIGPSIPTVPQSQGAANSYRRVGNKRPAYAPIPGLNSNPTNPLPTLNQPHGITPSISPKLQNIGFTPQQLLTPASEVKTQQEQASLNSQSNLTQPASSNFLNQPPTLQGSSSSSTPFLEPISSLDDINLQQDPALITIQNNTHHQFFNPSLSSSIMASLPPSEITNTSNHFNNLGSSQNQGFTSDGSPISNIVQNTVNQIYRPAYHHWFHKKEVESKEVWTPFSMTDSLALESAFVSPDISPDDLVATDGGRYDVNILRRQRIPVYWQGEPNEVRRCAWFYRKTEEPKYRPYEENIAAKLEEEYKIAFESNTWGRKVFLDNGEVVEFNGPDILIVNPPAPAPDAWGNTPAQPRPRIVKRGVDEFDIDEGEPAAVDHVLFMVHGIGSVCDLKFRKVEEVVDEFRSISLQLIRSHYRSSCDKQMSNRVEVLPISWHSKLHSDETGIDNLLKSITLESVPKIRQFTNDTLLDILFYTSPFYCQTIISTVGNELNRLFDLFKKRTPNFKGSVYLAGHSLGSLILFDLLCHQHPEPEKEEENNEEGDDDVITPLKSDKPHPKHRKISRRISYMMSNIGTGQAQIQYPHLNFQPITFFALGSPIGMFVTVRGLDNLGEQFALPTCPGFFNIFHPYDPVAYRVEALINPQVSGLKPVLIPHHKGRKRMHLELKETMVRVGADLKQKVVDSVKSTLNSFYQFALFNRQTNLEETVNMAIEAELQKEPEKLDEPEENFSLDNKQTDLSLGILNKGRRIDYVLQEAPFELIEYFFALQSHVCYWESEDTILLILKEIYSSMGIEPDNQVPQQTMTIERGSSSPNTQRSEKMGTTQIPQVFGMDPTGPMTIKSDMLPPPTSGFIRKS